MFSVDNFYVSTRFISHEQKHKAGYSARETAPATATTAKKRYNVLDDNEFTAFRIDANMQWDRNTRNQNDCSDFGRLQLPFVYFAHQKMHSFFYKWARCESVCVYILEWLN